jgi:hypothetical protein
MKLLKKIVFTTLLVFNAGCASDMIDVRAGSERVSLADANQVTSCQSKGKITVSVLAKVGFINRSVEDVEANLLQLARNGAAEVGADTVVKDELVVIGKRTFAMYKCRK